MIVGLALTAASTWTRFLIVVLGAYKQIKAQHAPVLQDLNEGNFDRAFALLRPGVQRVLVRLR